MYKICHTYITNPFTLSKQVKIPFLVGWLPQTDINALGVSSGGNFCKEGESKISDSLKTFIFHVCQICPVCHVVKFLGVTAGKVV